MTTGQKNHLAISLVKEESRVTWLEQAGPLGAAGLFDLEARRERIDGTATARRNVSARHAVAQGMPPGQPGRSQLRTCGSSTPTPVRTVVVASYAVPQRPPRATTPWGGEGAMNRLIPSL